MPTITCKYFTTVFDITKKDIETIEVGSSITVEEFLSQLIVKYGEKFGRHIYTEGTLDGKPYKTPNIYLNKSRIQWVQDFPDGLKTRITLQPGESATCNFTLNAYSPPAGDPKDNTAEVCVESMTGGKTDCDNDDSRVRSRDVLGRTITPSKTPPGGTAYTGSEGSLGFGAIALSLLLLGSGLVWAGYRRRQQYDG